MYMFGLAFLRRRLKRDERSLELASKARSSGSCLEFALSNSLDGSTARRSSFAAS
jgi:hypothetical protein